MGEFAELYYIIKYGSATDGIYYHQLDL